MVREHGNLLGTDDPAAATIAGAVDGNGVFVLLGDHAGRVVPRRLDNLGLGTGHLERHIAVDIGIAELGFKLCELLDAPFVSQAFSRLVIDCNRHPERADAMPEISDGIPVPRNVDLTAVARAVRIDEIHERYHIEIGMLLDRREQRGLRTVVVSLHSFTPVLAGRARPWTIGVLRGDGDETFAARVLAHLQRTPGLIVGDNEPYAFDDTDYTIARHALARGLEWVELEVRQDVLAAPDGGTRIAKLLARVLPLADAQRVATA